MPAKSFLLPIYNVLHVWHLVNTRLEFEQHLLHNIEKRNIQWWKTLHHCNFHYHRGENLVLFIVVMKFLFFTVFKETFINLIYNSVQRFNFVIGKIARLIIFHHHQHWEGISLINSSTLRWIWSILNGRKVTWIILDFSSDNTIFCGIKGRRILRVSFVNQGWCSLKGLFISLGWSISFRKPWKHPFTR